VYRKELLAISYYWILSQALVSGLLKPPVFLKMYFLFGKRKYQREPHAKSCLPAGRRNTQKRSVFKALPLINVESRRLHKMGEAAKSGQAPRLKSCDVSAPAYLLTTSRG
jgi:hypothetical protein